MHDSDEIIREAAELPVEERAHIVDSLLRTLNRPDPEVDRHWVEVAQRRLAELRAGTVRPIPGSDVFARIRERYTG